MRNPISLPLLILPFAAYMCIACQQEPEAPPSLEVQASKALMDSVSSLSPEAQRTYWLKRAHARMDSTRKERAAASAVRDSVVRVQRRRNAITAAQEEIESQLSAWDGSQSNVVEAVKLVLNDPNSFEHLETRTMRGTNYPNTYVVSMQYTAKNAFGGRVRGTIVCEVSVETGQVTQVFSFE